VNRNSAPRVGNVNEYGAGNSILTKIANHEHNRVDPTTGNTFQQTYAGVVVQDQQLVRAARSAIPATL
jgi:hypothetical protein